MNSAPRADGMTVGDLLRRIDALAPFALAEEWDNVGLIVGESGAPATRVLAALDLREHVLDEAERGGCDVVLVHHPPIFPSISRVTGDDPVGRLILQAARRGITIIAAHTNLDSAAGGLNDIMAALLGLTDTEVLAPEEPGALAGLGRVGTATGSLEALARAAENAFGASAITGAVGDPSRPVHRVAVCTGSGASFITTARDRGADVYVTGDLKYHDADRVPGMALICAAHGAVETECLREWVAGNAAALGCPISLSARSTDPWWGRRP